MCLGILGLKFHSRNVVEPHYNSSFCEGMVLQSLLPYFAELYSKDFFFIISGLISINPSSSLF
uniref:Uncharacterized protein n=1 Tax=Oryza brachyantha TaxID=4533 RepID=J3M7K3_ORYBR